VTVARVANHLVLLSIAAAAPGLAHAQTAKRDTTKAATKAPAAKPTTTAKPTTPAKPATTTKPAATSPAAPARPTNAPAARPAATATRPTARAPIGKPTPFDEGGTALYGGLTAVSLSFNAGPTAGLAFRKPMFAPALTLRADIAGSHHTQAALNGIAGASLTHVGASAGVELTLRRGPGIRPYVGAAAGIYRFQASGPAGKAAISAGDVFASTTDVAGIATVGLRLSSRLFVEGRYLTVSDFTSMPITVGVRF
jgi:hypothetical protein